LVGTECVDHGFEPLLHVVQLCLAISAIADLIMLLMLISAAFCIVLNK